MRKPNTPERLYLYFDGFFASVEQAARPGLRGKPVGVVPFSGAGDRGMIIACSREAKLQRSLRQANLLAYCLPARD